MSDLRLSIEWLDWLYIIAALVSLSFPLLYIFSPWYKSRMGRALMARGIGIAILTSTFAFLRAFDLQLQKNPGIQWDLIRVFALLAIISTSFYMTWTLFDLNYIQRNRKDDAHESRSDHEGGRKYDTDR